MYEEKTYKINWLGIIFKLLLVALIIGILFWIIPKTNNKAYKNEVFTNNLNNMKAAAKDYFKGDKLPLKIGDSKVITLDKMEESKLIVPFTDSENKACDAKNSYAQVTKNSDTEYSLKVNLSCDSKEEYILDSIETTSVSEPTPINPNENDDSDSEIIDNETNSNEPEENNNSNTDADSDIVIDANEIEGDKGGNLYEFEYAKINTTGSVEVTADPIKEYVETKESCPEGYTLNNNTCIKYVDATVVPGSTSYTCENGGTLSGTKCIITLDADVIPGETIKVCDDGWTLRGSTCVKTTIYGATQHKGSTSCSCPNGGSMSGNQCIKTSQSPAQTSTTPRTCQYRKADVGYTNWGNPIKIEHSSSKTLSTYTEDTIRKRLVNESTACTRAGVCDYVYYTETRDAYYYCTSGKLVGSQCEISCSGGNVTQSCADGSNPVNGTCYSTSSYTASCTTTNSTYTCDQGGNYNSNNHTCEREDSYSAKIENIPEKYDDCPAGYTKTSDGAHCTKTYDATKNEGTTTYTCPEGYTLDGTTCYKTTEVEKEDIYEYSCPEGYVKTEDGENTKCTKTVQVDGNYYCEDTNATLVDDKCVKKKQGAIRGYECPSGYIKEGTICIKKDVHCVYPSPHVIEEAKYEYTWSLKTELEGWERTGNQRIASSETLENVTIK